MNAVVRWGLDLLYPPKCMLCHRLMDDSDTATCGRCEYDLPEYDAAPRNVRFFEMTSATFHYKGYICDAIIRYKFHGMRSYSEQFSRWMSVRIQAELAGKYDMISWVPCSARRRWKRGYDQSQLLADELSRLLGVPCVRTLKKVKDTPKQSSLTDDAERRANVLGAYAPVDPERFRDKRILLIDDVLTTGATMSECGKTLRLAGAGDLVCAVIASAR